MDTWTPWQLFVAQYALAGLSALFALLMHKEKLSVGEIIGKTGWYCLVGGSLAPIIASHLSFLPEEVSRAAKVIGCAIGIGGGWISVKDVKARILKAFGDGGANGPDKSP